MAEEKNDNAKNDKKKPDMVLVGVIAAIAVGISTANYVVFDALSGRLDVLEANVMEQCGPLHARAGAVKAPKKAAPSTPAPPPKKPAPSTPAPEASE